MQAEYERLYRGGIKKESALLAAIGCAFPDFYFGFRDKFGRTFLHRALLDRRFRIAHALLDSQPNCLGAIDSEIIDIAIKNISIFKKVLIRLECDINYLICTVIQDQNLKLCEITFRLREFPVTNILIERIFLYHIPFKITKIPTYEFYKLLPLAIRYNYAYVHPLMDLGDLTEHGIELFKYAVDIKIIQKLVNNKNYILKIINDPQFMNIFVKQLKYFSINMFNMFDSYKYLIDYTYGGFPYYVIEQPRLIEILEVGLFNNEILTRNWYSTISIDKYYINNKIMYEEYHKSKFLFKILLRNKHSNNKKLNSFIQIANKIFPNYNMIFIELIENLWGLLPNHYEN